MPRFVTTDTVDFSIEEVWISCLERVYINYAKESHTSFFESIVILVIHVTLNHYSHWTIDMMTGWSGTHVNKLNSNCQGIRQISFICGIFNHMLSEWTQLQRNAMKASIKNSLGPGGHDEGIPRITDHDSNVFHEFQNGWYICSEKFFLKMCNHIEEICPRVSDAIKDLMVPIWSSYKGLIQAKWSKSLGAHQIGD